MVYTGPGPLWKTRISAPTVKPECYTSRIFLPWTSKLLSDPEQIDTVLRVRIPVGLLFGPDPDHGGSMPGYKSLQT